MSRVLCAGPLRGRAGRFIACTRGGCAPAARADHESAAETAARLDLQLRDRTGTLDRLKRELWLYDNVDKKARKKEAKAARKAKKKQSGRDVPVHSSRNVLGWLWDEEHARLATVPEGEHVRFARATMFCSAGCLA